MSVAAGPDDLGRPRLVIEDMRESAQALSRLGLLRLLLLALCVLSAHAQEEASSPDNDLAGPVVRASVDRLKDALVKANLTGDGAEKKKTIAQIIDEALEQEFPEEKQEAIGKNYNETAKPGGCECSSSGHSGYTASYNLPNPKL